jgi:hypothetical protein
MSPGTHCPLGVNLQFSEEKDEQEALTLVQDQEVDIAEAATAAVAPVLRSFDDDMPALLQPTDHRP